jgi:hypothetical protein
VNFRQFHPIDGHLGLMTDDEFLDSIANGSLPAQQFNHLGHLRLAWINLQRRPLDEAVGATCQAIRTYATHLGAAGKFHWTITEALMRLLHASGAADRGMDWRAYLAANGALIADARARLALHYSEQLLASSEARLRFVAPDLAPLAR